jgi:DNA replication protein DnaC
MSAHDHLIAMLNRLKLAALRDQLDSLIDEAGRRDLTIRDALALFCEREIARRDQRRIDMSFGLARFPFVRDLAGFDFGAQPSIDRAQVREIANGEAVLLLGPPGVGKTHLAVAIGREAIVTGHCSRRRRHWWRNSPRRMPMAGSMSACHTMPSPNC